MVAQGSRLRRDGIVDERKIPVDLYDFFFAEQAQATHLRQIAKQGSLVRRPSSGIDHSSDLEALREDVRFLTLVIAALLRRCTETEMLSLVDVQDLLDEIDALDGVPDGGLDPGVLRGLLSVLKVDKDAQPENANEEFKIVTQSRYRKR